MKLAMEETLYHPMGKSWIWGLMGFQGSPWCKISSINRTGEGCRVLADGPEPNLDLMPLALNFAPCAQSLYPTTVEGIPTDLLLVQAAESGQVQRCEG